MAQRQRLGSILLRSAFRVSPSHHHQHPGNLPSSFILSRHLSGSKLFVGGLSYRTDEEGLRNAFASHGEVADVRIITDRESGRSRGFGFVTYLSESDAETALSKMDGHVLDGRIIRVDRASARPPAPRPPPASSAADGADSGPPPPFFEAPPPSSPEDWGTIPAFDAAVSQNIVSASTSEPPNDSSEAKPVSSDVGDKASEGSTSSDTPASNQSSSITSSLDSGSPNTESKPAASANVSSVADVSPAASANVSSVADISPAASANVSSVADISPAASANVSSVPDISAAASANVSSVPDISPAPISSSDLDLSDFPPFEDSAYEDEPPLPRRRPRPRPRPIPQSTVSEYSYSPPPSEEVRSPFGSTSDSGAAVPKAKDQEFDFGLTGVGDPPPPCEPGTRPQGAFDITLPADLKELPPEPPAPPKPKPLFSMFPLRTLPPDDLPYDTPEADNWSDIGKEPPKYDLSMLFGPGKSFIKKDKELHWDPYDFDKDAKLPPEPEDDGDSSD